MMNAARASCLYGNNILTFVVYCPCVYCQPSGNRARRLWVHDILSRRQKYGEHYRLGRKKKMKDSRCLKN